MCISAFLNYTVFYASSPWNISYIWVFVDWTATVVESCCMDKCDWTPKMSLSIIQVNTRMLVFIAEHATRRTSHKEVSNNQVLSKSEEYPEDPAEWEDV